MSTLYIDADTQPPNLDRVTVVSVSPLLRELILHLVREQLTKAAHDRIEAVLIDQLAQIRRDPSNSRGWSMNDFRPSPLLSSGIRATVGPCGSSAPM